MYKMHETLWFCSVSGLNTSVGVLGLSVVCVPLQDDTPICHDCLVVNGTNRFIISYIFTARLLGC